MRKERKHYTGEEKVAILRRHLLAFLSRVHRIGRKQLLGTAAIALVAGSFIVRLGVSKAIERFEQLTHGGISRELRVSIYQDTSRIVLDHPWLDGLRNPIIVGVYPRYASFYNGLTVDHAHNDYLELLAETGIVGGMCGLFFVALLLWQGFGTLQSAAGHFARTVIAGSLAACAGLLLHSLVDFNLHIPSNCLIFLLLSCIATADWTKASLCRHVSPTCESDESTVLFSHPIPRNI